MNIEDYYKTLELRPNASQVKIAFHYFKLVNRNFSLIENNVNKECFYKVNRAVEVLRNEATRKYYDVVYNEVKNKSFDKNNPAIQKYLKIINKAISTGNHKADLLLNNSEYRNLSGKIQSPRTFWLKLLFYLNPRLDQFKQYLSLPILNLIYLFIGILLIFNQFENFNIDYLIIGIMITLFSISFLYINFVVFIIEKTNK